MTDLETPAGDTVGAADPAGMAGLPSRLREQAAATLLVDLERDEVVHANLLAVDLAPGLHLPVPLATWSEAAGLRTADGTPLDRAVHTLTSVAGGSPARGMQVSAARASATTFAREPLWLIGVPLVDAPGPLVGQALVILLPMSLGAEVQALQHLGHDLHTRAAIASDLSFTISDPNQPDDPLIWVNPAFERVTGYSAEDAVGRNCRFLQGEHTDRAVVGRMREALDAGVTIADTLLNYRKDGTPFWNQVVISPVLDSEGRVTHHVGIQADVTARIDSQVARETALDRARVSTERLELLAEVSGTLAQHLDYGTAVTALAELAVPRLATWGFVAVTNDRGGVETLHVATRDPGSRAAAEALEHDDVSWLTRSPSVQEALASDLGHVAAPFPVDVASLPGRTTRAQLELLERLGLAHALVVPLRARDRVLGVMCLVVGPGAAFSEDDVVTAAHIGHRAGLGLDNVRLYAREREAALTLQRSLLPEIPDLPGLDVAAAYIPALRRAQVGGDWFDVLALPDGAVGLAVGDVVGHDLNAAASMGQLRSVLRSYAWAGDPAAAVVGRLDELVRGLGMADIATCVYLRLEDGAAHYTRAGHPPPLLRAPDGEVAWLDAGLTTPVGIPTLGRPIEEGRVLLEPGATLVIYTDGLVERRDRSLREGMDALGAELRGLAVDASAEQVCSALLARFVEEDQEDDVCLLVVRVEA